MYPIPYDFAIVMSKWLDYNMNLSLLLWEINHYHEYCWHEQVQLVQTEVFLEIPVCFWDSSEERGNKHCCCSLQRKNGALWSLCLGLRMDQSVLVPAVDCFVASTEHVELLYLPNKITHFHIFRVMWIQLMKIMITQIRKHDHLREKMKWEIVIPVCYIYKRPDRVDTTMKLNHNKSHNSDSLSEPTNYDSFTNHMSRHELDSRHKSGPQKNNS